MEAVFLACFLFGVVFTLASVALGFVHAFGGDGSNFGDGGDLGHGADGGGHVDTGHVDTGHADGGHVDAGHGEAGHGYHPLAGAGRVLLSVFSASAMLAFLTWFGAAGYLLLQFAAWPLLAALPVAVLAGGAGGYAMARFLAFVRRGERVMDPRDYRLEGTLARVTVTIPENGVGEVVFQKAGSRRSEAARGYNGRPIPRGVEVAIVDYQHGIATVDPLRDDGAEQEPVRQEREAP